MATSWRPAPSTSVVGQDGLVAAAEGDVAGGFGFVGALVEGEFGVVAEGEGGAVAGAGDQAVAVRVVDV